MKKFFKLGILANELFSTQIGRMGGFGWAVQQLSRCFSQPDECGVEPVLLMGERMRTNESLPTFVHGVRVIWLKNSFPAWAKEVRQEGIDVLLTIDYRPNYRAFFALLPRTPVVVWVRDPWDREDRKRIATLRVPDDNAQPQGVLPPNTQSISAVVTLSNWIKRRLVFAVTTPALIPKIRDTYRVDQPEVIVLPNIIKPYTGSPDKSARPTVAFLARLDPVKRPWLMIELARRFPDVDFVVMGQSHFQGAGSWQLTDIPTNIKMIGHADEHSKLQHLASAWLLLNTSIHEGLSVSFLEALACETPIISSVNTENVVSRFGRYVGEWSGTGMDGLTAFEDALRDLLNHHEERKHLGRSGREWVEQTHSQTTFMQAFTSCCQLLSGDKARD